MTLNKFIYVFLTIAMLAGCNKIPSDYSEVVYQQAIFKGESIDTIFISADSGYFTLHGGDTCYVDIDSLVYHLRYFSSYEDMQPSVFFDLTTGDNFFINVKVSDKSDTVVIPGFDKSDVKMVKKEVVPFSSYKSNIIYHFSAVRSSKNVIDFRQFLTDDLRKLKTIIATGTVCYCTDISDSVRFKTDSLSWSLLYKNGGQDSADTTWYFNRFTMNGNTDALQILITGSFGESSYGWWDSPMHTDTVAVKNGRSSVIYNRNWVYKYDAWSRPLGDYDYVPSDLAVKVVLRGTKGPDPTIHINCPEIPVK